MTIVLNNNVLDPHNEHFHQALYENQYTFGAHHFETADPIRKCGETLARTSAAKMPEKTAKATSSLGVLEIPSIFEKI